ncbi:NAD+ diphosphatase [Entomortierella parvispora]|uniref:NAD(+) diphosphatase n=1 Tax=Entomortierella parvispora TaxID=205924 RepID=A0A9P3HFL7_9FUNG|nr:NAD+ diphosphatase [Entomortierella parvispora]
MSQQPTDIFEAAASGNLDYIKSLGRIHLEAKNDRGWTPLMFAARYGHSTVVEYLLAEAKVDPMVTNKDNKTAADLAEFWGSAEALAVFDRLAPKSRTVARAVTGSGSPFSSASSGMAAAAGIVTDGSKSSTMADWWKRRTVHENKPLHFTGGIHNRLSFLRTDKEYLHASVQAPTTKFLLLADHGVLFKSSTKDLAFVSHQDIQHLIGSDPLNNLPEGLVLVFLGADETGTEETLVHGRRGVGYWALDMSAKGPGVKQELKDAVESFTNSLTEKHGHYMAEARPAAFGLSFPENPVVIVCVISPDGDRVLLGRQAVWPQGMYSCLAGFVEPGESLEEAARREVKEESGIRLGHVMYHSSQPWPFPNSLMIGCHAEALNEDPNVTLEDKELEDARWFSRSQILEALKGSRGVNWGKPSEGNQLRLPPATAIAHHILKAWATEEGEIPQSKM